MNYFNYYTEIEEHFQRARGTALFLLSPLDWALVETWKAAGIPLAAVLRGIDATFAKWRGRKSNTQKVNGLAFCAQAVMMEAQLSTGERPQAKEPAPPPFPIDDLRTYLQTNAEAVRVRLPEIAAALDKILADLEIHFMNLEALEQRLTMLEEKMMAIARASQSDDNLLAARQDLDRQLRPYRGKMTAEQLTMLEKQFLERRLLETVGLPRLSLFYLR